MIHDFNNCINFLKEYYADKLENCTKEDELNSCQLGFGHLVEHNLIKAIEYCAKENHVRAVKTNKDYDMYFGADAHMEFMSPINDKINGMSCYLDITLSSDKPRINFNADKTLCTLSNGLELSLGYKHINHVFVYEKPILLVMLRSTGDKKIAPFFSANDIRIIIKYLRQACLYLSYDFKYNFNGATKIGTGKESSTNIIINENILLG